MVHIKIVRVIRNSYLFALAVSSWLYLQIWESSEAPAVPAKELTASRLQFFGIITSEYLDQINPVARRVASTVLSFSAGLAMPAGSAHTNPHFVIGAQKKTLWDRLGGCTMASSSQEELPLHQGPGCRWPAGPGCRRLTFLWMSDHGQPCGRVATCLFLAGGEG